MIDNEPCRRIKQPDDAAMMCDRDAGFLVSNSTFKCLVMRYSDKTGQVYFDDFILCAVRLKTMFGQFSVHTACRRENKETETEIKYDAVLNLMHGCKNVDITL